jgi:RNA polymerase sigma factor (sigma-70 family)
MSAADDLALLDAWRAGDAAAGEALFERHFECIYRFFCNKIDRDVDDLVQETFLGCLHARDRFRADSSFRTFLFAIARNKLLKYLERARRRDGEDLQESRVVDLDANPVQFLVRTEEQGVLLRALRRLPIDLQIALELYYWETMTSAEIAVVLDIPHGTARSRLRRAREILREKVELVTVDPSLRESTLGSFEHWLSSMRRRVGPGDGRVSEIA